MITVILKLIAKQRRLTQATVRTQPQLIGPQFFDGIYEILDNRYRVEI